MHADASFEGTWVKWIPPRTADGGTSNREIVHVHSCRRNIKIRIIPGVGETTHLQAVNAGVLNGSYIHLPARGNKGPKR